MTSSVWPSGTAFAAISEPSVLPAPGRFSTTTVWPQASVSFCPRMREKMSAAPAGAADIFSRILGQKLTDAWGQTVVVENRPGAGSTLGSEIAANAVPDGHTLLVISASYATSAGLYRSVIRYHPIN